MIIVDLIKELMYQMDMTSRDVSKATGLPIEIIENIVNKDIIPTPENADIILNVLGATLEEVLSLY